MARRLLCENWVGPKGRSNTGRSGQIVPGIFHQQAVAGRADVVPGTVFMWSGIDQKRLFSFRTASSGESSEINSGAWNVVCVYDETFVTIEQGVNHGEKVRQESPERSEECGAQGEAW